MRAVLRAILPLFLPLVLIAGRAEAAVRKCGVPPSLTTGVLLVDEVRAGTFDMGMRDGFLSIPASAGAEIPPDEILHRQIGCIEQVDPVSKQKIGYVTVEIYTKSGVEKLVASMDELLRELAAAQEAYRAGHGHYTASLASLPGFENHFQLRQLQVGAVRDGWSARLHYPFSSRRCSVAVGITPPDPGAKSGEVFCTGETPGAE